MGKQAFRTHRSHGVALTLALAALAGCQTAQPTGPATEQVLNKPAAGAAAPAAAAAATGTAVTPEALGLRKAAIGADEFRLLQPGGDKLLLDASLVVDGQIVRPNERGVIKLPAASSLGNGQHVVNIEAPGYVPMTIPVVGGAALVMVPLDANLTAVTAANGGIASNADGSLQVTFAPGALDKDAKVSVTRVYRDKSNAYYTPATPAGSTRDDLGSYDYHLELDGATLQPGAAVVARFKIQDKLKDHFETMLKEDPTLKGSNIKDEFSKDATGDIWFSMKHSDVLPTPAELLSKAYGLLAAACNTYPDFYMENRRRVVVSNVSAGDCRNTGNGGIAFHDFRYNNGHCQYWDSRYDCADNRTVVENYQVRINVPSSTAIARVRWSSDDDRISGPVYNALVDWSHAGTAQRNPTDYAYTDQSGEAGGVGAQGASGTASVSKPGEPWTRGSGGGYTVNCSPASFTIIKNKPWVTLNFTPYGTPTSPNYDLRSTHGNQTVSSLSNPSFPVSFNAATNSVENFSLAGSWQPNGDTWLDASSDTAGLKWNNFNSSWASTNVPAKIWFSTKIGVTLKYASDDRLVPADQQPTIDWHAKNALANVELTHDVSSYASKAHADIKSFVAASGRVDTWGLNRATGMAAASVTGPGADPVILSGTKAYTVDGGTAALEVNANLPAMAIDIGTQETTTTSFTMVFTIDGLRRSMTVNKVGSTLRFSIPVEDQLHQPAKHAFKILTLSDNITTFEMANRAPFPTMSVQRAASYNHASINGFLTVPK